MTSFSTAAAKVIASVTWLVGCVAQLAERWSLARELTLSCAQPAANGWPPVGKPSTTGQPTRPTQPFILLES